MEYFKRLFQGRINRRTYFIGLIPIVILLLIAGVLNDASVFSAQEGIATILLILLPSLLMLLFLMSITIRRLHDVGEDPWLNPKNAFWIQGQKKENKYGKPPKPIIDIKALFGFS